jgi:predicted phage-related endonuclease
VIDMLGPTVEGPPTPPLIVRKATKVASAPIGTALPDVSPRQELPEGGIAVGPGDRTTTVGSSDVAGILGLSPWAGPWDAYARLTGLVPRYSETDTPAQARGRMMELGIGERWAIERGLVFGVDVVRGPSITAPPLVHPTVPWIAGRPDFFAAPVKAILEGKTSRSFGDDWGPTAAPRLPVYYACQVAWQLAVVVHTHGIETCHVGALSMTDDEWRVIVVHRSERIERRLVARVRDWFERHVLAGVPPPLDGSDGCGVALGKMHPRVRQQTREADAVDLALARDLARVRRELADLGSQDARIVNAIKARMGDAGTLYADGRKLAAWSERRGRETVDLDGLRAEAPDLVAKHTRPRGETTRSFTFTPPKEL